MSKVFSLRVGDRMPYIAYDFGFSLAEAVSVSFSARDSDTQAVFIDRQPAQIADGTYTINGTEQVLTPADGVVFNPWAAPVLDWRVGLGLAVEALTYGIPLTVLFPLVDWLGGIPEKDDPRLTTWRWTALQALAAGAIALAIVALRSDQGSDFIYFQF